MTRVLCPQRNCVFWDDGKCEADEIALDPEQLSCITMEDVKELILGGEGLEDGWDMDEDEGDEDGDDWGDEGYGGEDDDAWEPY